MVRVSQKRFELTFVRNLPKVEKPEKPAFAEKPASQRVAENEAKAAMPVLASRNAAARDTQRAVGGIAQQDASRWKSPLERLYHKMPNDGKTCTC